jgi:hypothetical protein
LVCYRCDVDRLLTREPALGPGEIEERLDQALLLLTAGDYALAHRAPCDFVRVRISECCFCECELKRDRRAQLVRNVRGEGIRLVGRVRPWVSRASRLAAILEAGRVPGRRSVVLVGGLEHSLDSGI